MKTPSGTGGFILLAALLAAGVPAHAANLLFRSGFGDGVALELTPDTGRIVGVDQDTGFSWNDDLARLPAFTGSKLGDLGRIPEDRDFQLVQTSPAGGRALLMRVLNNNQTAASTRADFTLRFGRDPAFKQLCVRFRMKLDPLYPAAIKATGEWFQLTEYKSMVGADHFRKTLAIRVERDGNRFYPAAQWRNLESGLKKGKTIVPLWTVPNRAAAIPFGEWFDVEMFLKLGPAGVGRFYYSINGATVFDIRDKDTVSMDPPLPLAHWSIFKIYQHPDIIRWMREHGSACQAWYDDLEIWDDLPTATDRAALTGAIDRHPAKEEIKAAMRRVFDWQAANQWSSNNPVDRHNGTRGWVRGTLLSGTMEAWRATGDPAYLDFARATAAANSWRTGPRPGHADDITVSQTYIELHQIAPAPGQLDATIAELDAIIASAPRGRELWDWCDALYMAPPTFAKLSEATGDPRYLAAMDELYWDVHDALYDREERLYYRDARFIDPPDGRKVFWSRGNGWVVAGLARLLDVLPAGHPSRPRYVELFREMAGRLVELQPADGLWRANLLHPEDSHGEASGSAFFCYALAWGINNGILDKPATRAAAGRAWTALLGCVDAAGRLGWVQPIGAAPDVYSADTWQEYGTGAFLAAGAQMLRLP